MRPVCPFHRQEAKKGREKIRERRERQRSERREERWRWNQRDKLEEERRERGGGHISTA